MLSRYADHINATFGAEPGKKRGYGGHPEIELALVRLYRETGERRFLELSKYLLEERGQPNPNYYDVEARERGENPDDFWADTYEYCQAHAPIREQDKVVGHAVRCMYLMSGVADLANEYDDPTLYGTCVDLWHNLVHQRMYVTGGIGPSKANEGFTFDYDLPDVTAYAETCAAIALIMWNHRLLQFAGDGKYADIIELTLYNGFISGVSLEGKDFFYVNPLASTGDHHRTEWFACPCCPPNLSRILQSMGNYYYSTGQSDLWVHQYSQNEAELEVDGQTVSLTVKTNYPCGGQIVMQMQPEASQDFALHLRIPGWCRQWQVNVNDIPVDDLSVENGYISIERTWQPDDTVTLLLEMPVQAVYANPNVQQLLGRTAIMRGPIVYCMESADNRIPLERISLDAEAIASCQVEFQPELLGGIAVIQGEALVVDDQNWDESTLYRRDNAPTQKTTPFTAIPYAVWDNREPGVMRVWFRSDAT